MEDKNKITEIIKEISGVSVEGISDDSPLNNFGIDSMVFTKILIQMEETYGFELSSEDVEAAVMKATLKTLRNIVERNSSPV